jgi:hypothetical protein
MRQRSLSKDSIPDVVATNTSGSVLFIGDAKYSEVPSDVECRARIFRYLRVTCKRVRGRVKFAIFALSYGNEFYGSGWREAILSAIRESRLTAISFRIITFQPNSHVIIFLITLG